LCNTNLAEQEYGEIEDGYWFHSSEAQPCAAAYRRVKQMPAGRLLYLPSIPKIAFRKAGDEL
jgi:hypothetical protein